MILVAFMCINLAAQESYKVGDEVIIVFKNGDKIKGDFISKDATSYTLQVGKDKVVIPIENVQYISTDEISLIDTDSAGQYKDYADQYFIFPSALPVEKGSVYYKNSDLFVNTFAFGLTERVSLNFGFETVSLLNGNSPGFYFSPKVNIPFSEQVHFSVGNTFASIDSEIANILFGNVTFGDTRNNITIGIGVGWESGNFVDEPVWTLGTQLSLSNKAALIAEVLLIDLTNNPTGLIDLAFRIKTKGNYAFDFGIITALDDSDFDVAIPLVSFIIPLKE